MAESLLKTTLKTSLAEATVNEIQCGTANYYHFWGRTADWSGSVEVPQDSLKYEIQARDNAINLKKISSSDVIYVIPRHDWVNGTVYDMYDDAVGSYITVSATGNAATKTLTGTFDLSTFGVGWSVSGTNIAAGTTVVGASGAIVLSHFPTGVVSSVTITKKTSSGAVTLADPTCNFYCVTSENRVYKCLFNNGGTPSTVEPYWTTHTPFETADGYIWKYMYTIPRYFLNKFATAAEIPVTTANGSLFYSNGSINAVKILSGGANYDSNTSLVVSGDGRATNGIYKILAISIDTVGSGYGSAPTVTIDPPVSSLAFVGSTSYNAGQQISTTAGHIYSVYVSGISGATAPTFVGPDFVANGTLSLKYVGTTVRATATVSSGAVNSIIPIGYVGKVTVTSPGSGYNPNRGPLAVAFSSVVGTTPSATATVSVNGKITQTHIINAGEITSGTPTATIDGPPSITKSFNSTTNVNYTLNTITISNHTFVTGDYVLFNSNVTAYIIAVDTDTIQLATTFANANAATALSLSTLGMAANQSYTIQTNGTTAQLAVQVEYGAGYIVEPAVTLSAPTSGTTATASVISEIQHAKLNPIISAGQIVGVDIEDCGVGYTTATVTVNGEGTGAVLEPVYATKTLDSQQARIEALAVPGSIEVIEVLHGGLNYATATCTVAGDGTGCEITPVIDSVTGSIVDVTVDSPGTGYTHATITITGTAKNGTTIVPAYLRAIISPKFGHGSNAVKELNASDVLMSTRIEPLTKQSGFDVPGYLHQYGVIKNPLIFGTANRFTKQNGSACIVIVGNFEYAKVPVGAKLVDANQLQYTVLANPTSNSGATGVSILVQSAGTTTPTVGDVLSYQSYPSQSATISAVMYPDVDKYSGEMLYLCNSESFQSTTNQTVSLNTYFRF